MIHTLKGRTNIPRSERGQDIPSVDMPDFWKDYFKAKINNHCGVITDVRAPTAIYCTDVARSK